MGWLTLAALAAVVRQGSTGLEVKPYTLNQSYVSEDFFSYFTFFDLPDPTHGFVEYVDQRTAEADGLARATSDRVYMGVDMKTAAGSDLRGRKSVRVQSKEIYNAGLFVAVIDHLPTGCGTWPAFWMYGEDEQHLWPEWGEFDVIEGVHRGARAMTTLHTKATCPQASLVAGKDFLGEWEQGTEKVADDCDVGAPGQWGNQGCSQTGPEGTIGDAFNSQGGGTFAAEWDPDAGHIRTWFWPRGSEPLDLTQRTPDPDSWGTPYSMFRLGPDLCPADYFQNMRIVFDITLCGDLAGPTFHIGCPDIPKEVTCEEFVAQHPEAMNEAFWSVHILDVYQRQAVLSTQTTTTTTRTSTTTSRASTSSAVSATSAPTAAPTPQPTSPPTAQQEPARSPEPEGSTVAPTAAPIIAPTPQPTPSPTSQSTAAATTMRPSTPSSTRSVSRAEEAAPAPSEVPTTSTITGTTVRPPTPIRPGPRAPLSLVDPGELFPVARRRHGQAAPSGLFAGRGAAKPLPTAAWWQNLAVRADAAGPAGNVFQMPYVVKAGSYGISATMPFSDGPADQSFDFGQAVQLSAVESLESPRVHAWDELTVTLGWQLSSQHVGKGDGVSVPLVRGSPYITAEFANATPSLNTSQRLQPGFLVDGKEAQCSSSGSLAGRALTFALVESDATWMLFSSEDLTWRCQSSPFSLTAEGPYTGAVRIALANNCTTGSGRRHCHGAPRGRDTASYAAVLLEHAGRYPVSASVDFKVEGDFGMVIWRWGTRSLSGWTENRQLLQLAWPAQLSVLQLDDLTLRSLGIVFRDLRGTAVAILGDEWQMLYELLPDAGFAAPRPVARVLRKSILQALRGDRGAMWNGSAADRDFDLPREYRLGVGDTYFSGKMLARLARVISIADELGETQESYFSDMVDRLASRLEVWLRDGAETPFVYDAAWGGLVSCGCDFADCSGQCEPHCSNQVDPPDACPALSDAESDFGNGFYVGHHAQYGYFVFAAAVVAKHRPEWEVKWREKILALIRDYANPSHEDPSFPVVRHKDWFLGFSWSAGIEEAFVSGRYQESVAEAVNAYYALYAYGAAVSSAPFAEELRNLGRLLTAMEAHGANLYWHRRLASNVYLKDYQHWVVGILRDHAVEHRTAFGRSSYEVGGEQLVPFTPASESYLEPVWVAEHWQGFKVACEAEKACAARGWSSAVCLEQAVLDPTGALLCLQKLPPNAFSPNTLGASGNSLTNSLYWIATRPYTPASWRDVRFEGDVAFSDDADQIVDWDLREVAPPRLRLRAMTDNIQREGAGTRARVQATLDESARGKR